jgi:hypothetical protein
VATIAQVMDAIAAQLENELQPQTTIDLNIHGRAFAAAAMPAIDMLVTPATGLESLLQGFDDIANVIPITIRVRVSTADLYTGEDLLLAFMDDKDDLSILAALDADHTLGGWAQDITWSDGFPWTGYTDFPDINGDGYALGSTMPIVVTKALS